MMPLSNYIETMESKKFKEQIPLIKFSELDNEQALDIAIKVFKRMNEDDGCMYKSYIAVLAKNRIMCPHPQHKRVYGDKISLYSLREYKWYSCKMCDCSVLNEDYENG